MPASDHADSDQYIDLEIRIFPKGDEGYPAEITLGGQQRFKRGHLSADILPWAPSGDLRADGRRLFDTLFANRVLRSAWDQAVGRSLQRRIRLWIDENAAELHALPWELLRDDQVGSDMLSAQKDTPFSRYLRVDLPWSGPVEERPIRVLVVISSPNDLEARYDLAPVDVGLEREILESAFTTVERDELQADFLDAPMTIERLEETLHSGYHVLHFVGHGAFSNRRGQAALYVQDQEEHARRVLDDELAGLLKRQGGQLRLVSLVACQSAARSTTDAFLGLGPKLITAGVPAVVAMQDDVTVETGRKFSATFYRRLLAHGQVDLAVNEARSALLTAGRPDAAVPVLFMRVSDGLLFAPPAVDTEEKHREPKPADDTPTPPPIDPAQVNPIKLRKAMIEAYDKPGLVALCNDLAFEYNDRSVEYDNLRGESLSNKVLYLIDWHRRRRHMADLVRKVLQEHPFLADELV